MFLNPNNNSVNKNCSDLSLFELGDRRGFMPPQLKTNTVRTNFSSDLKIFANSWPSALNFKSFSRSLEQLFLTVGQNNFGNKIQFIRGIGLGQTW